ncbi:hypothetical protein FOE78_00490 [Microlunatus elymi]|uniref:ATP-grasp domain-containing protein n=1 Tax=Microlunatus elymi TaxID=2596828 RepID=A0A516PTW4_9ACTN|nr:hypothetical protein [Microlunatus elymi]QDP94592.1 hypothetical protein FOE78_00490 [Microlunatus elymi]
MALTIMIGFADAFSAIEVAWSLQSAGFSVVALNRSGTRPALRHVRGVRLIEVTRPEHSAARCLDDITTAVESIGPAAMMPLDDASLWLFSRVDAGESVLVGPDRNGADWALNKAAQLRTASAHGLAVPDTLVITAASQLDTLDLPCIVKPSAAVELVDDHLVRPTGRVCGDRSEVDRARTSLSGYPLLAQPIKTGVGEGVFGYVGPEGPTAWSAHRRVRMVNPQGSASSACESADPDPALLNSVSAMMAALGWRGQFMAEFLRDVDGTPWFMEVNGRAWGSMALSRRRGYEYPAWTVQQALGLPIRPSVPVDAPHVRCRHVGREILHAAFVWRGPQSQALDHWPKRGATIRGLLTVQRRDRVYNWNRRQPHVLLADTWQALSSQARGRKRAVR